MHDVSDAVKCDTVQNLKGLTFILVTQGHSYRHPRFVSQIVVVCFGSKRRASGPDFLASIADG
jgi:hypothetical protein